MTTRTSPTSLIAAAAMLFFTTLPLHAAPPAIDALKAAKIATDYLAKRGSGSPHIVSVALESGALVGGTTSWVIRWSDSIELSDGDREIGLRVKLDGSLARLIEGKNSAGKPKRSIKDR